MSSNTDSPKGLAEQPWMRIADSFLTPHPSAPLIYPDTGASQHLPVRRTITGDAAQNNPKATRIFLRNLPGHCYSLPRVSMNFTIVEIIVFLPNWFKYKDICERFMNNNLTAKVHFMILEDHRELQLQTELDCNKARSTLTDDYRRTMRSIYPGWKKAKNTAPADWDATMMGMGGYVPDDMRQDGYRQVPPILFRDLILGVKKLPEGVHAGDLTRALQFALGVSENLMFPDDLPSILDHIGRTQLTVAHSDRPIVRGYIDSKYVDEAKKLHATIGPKNNTGTDTTISITSESENQNRVHNQSGVTLQEAGTPQQMPPKSLSTSGFPHDAQPLAQINVATESRVLVNHTDGGQGGLSRGEMEMEVLLRQHLGHGVSVLGYAPDQLLRDCMEGDILFDGSPLARAARFAQRPDQADISWCVAHVAWLVQLLDAAQSELSA